MRSVVVALALSVLLAGCSPTGPQDSAPTGRAATLSPAAALEWNAVAIDASGLDHTPAAPSESRTTLEQMGPGRASRAMAIVHIAMFEAANAILGGYRSFVNMPRATGAARLEAAIAQAAHDTLVALYPSQRTALDAKLALATARLANDDARANGLEVGRRAAAAILANRAHDGGVQTDPEIGVDHPCSNDPGRWRMDPVSRNPLALGVHWGEVRPFALASASQFRCPAPPAPGTAEYREALAEVRALGGDGITTPTSRSLTQTIIGIFWAYDGGPTLCAPPRLYNQIATLIATERGTPLLPMLRLLALVNVAMADAGIAAWESKWYWDYWRPVCAIREAGDGAGPSGLGDGDPLTTGDPTFTPLGAPASNSARVNFTPPFPGYPSGHATFGGALFQTLRNFYGTDEISFSFVSDEFNDRTTDNTGQVRPRVERYFERLSQAEDENGQSRIYLGIHFRFDKTAGIEQGRQCADQVYRELFRPE